MITHLEPDILECEVKWAWESITTNKASGGDGIPVELFQVLKDDAVKVLHLIYQQVWKIQQGPQDQKRSVFIPIPKKGNLLLEHQVSHKKWVHAQSCLTLWPHGLQPTRLPCPRDFTGKNTEEGCHFLLHGIFLTQGLNLHLLNW